MCIRVLQFIVTAGILVPELVFCNSYFVSPFGVDTNPGSFGLPWRTIGKANATVQPGDTVYIRAGTYVDPVEPLQRGRAGGIIVYKNYPGETPDLSGSYGVHLSGAKSYVVIEGLRLMNNDAGVAIENSSRITLVRCIIVGSKGWQAVRLSNATYCKVLENLIDRQDPKPDYGENGDGIALVDVSTNNLIDGNTVTGCYHVAITSAYGGQTMNIIRNNLVYMNHTAFSLQDGVSRTVVSNNKAYYPGRIRPDWGGHDLQLTGDNNIIRNNIFYDDTLGGVGTKVEQLVSYYAVAEWGNTFSVRSNKTAHNTFYGETDEVYAKYLLRVSNWTEGGIAELNDFKNNILAKGSLCQVMQDDGDRLLGDFSGEFDGNLIWQGSVGDKVIDYYAKNGSSSLTLAEASSAKPSTWLRQNIEANPLFVSTLGEGSAKDFALRSGSPAIDAGVPLANTTNSGQNSTIVTVTDAGWFCDGFGIAEGDWIRVNGGSPVQIAAVNYDSKVLSLVTPTSWVQGARVDYTYRGAGPDIGAIEFDDSSEATAPPPTPVLATPADGSTGVAVNALFAWDRAAGARSYRLQVATTQSFDQRILDVSGLVSTSYSAQKLSFSTTYYWRVSATNNLGSSAWTPARSFTTASDPMPAPSAGVNIISNPSFAAGTDFWAWFTDGVASFAVGSPGYGGPQAATFTIARAGSNVQFYQHNLVIEPKKTYRLSFDAYSTTGHDVDVSLLMHGWPYTNLGLSGRKFDLSSGWNQYVVEFTSPDLDSSVSDARLQFWLAPYAVAGDQYWIDEVELVKVGGATDVSANAEVPIDYMLEQNYPNPFNPSTVLRYALPVSSFLTLKVYDIIGRETATLYEGVQTAGMHQAVFRSSTAPSGVYFCRIQTPRFTQTVKMLLVK